jgi:nitroreductase
MALVRERRSVREFLDKPVERDLIACIIEAASWAPSASNRQDWLFSVVESAELKAAMAAAVRSRWQAIIGAHRELGMIDEIRGYAASFADFATAPVVIGVSAAKVNAVQQELLGPAGPATVGGFASAAMAAQNLMLAAHALGLATCCMTGALAAQEELAKLLGLGRGRELVCLIALGCPADEPPAPVRKPASAIARFHR